jgi:hypothetical protein
MNALIQEAATATASTANRPDSGFPAINCSPAEESMSTTRILKVNGERITPEWLRAVADEIDEQSQWAMFEVENDIGQQPSGWGGYTKVFVDMQDDSRSSAAIEIETAVESSDGPLKTRLGIGLYRYRDDVLALLEILARGSHGF